MAQNRDDRKRRSQNTDHIAKAAVLGACEGDGGGEREAETASKRGGQAVVSADKPQRKPQHEL